MFQALHNVFRTGDTNADEVLNSLKTTVDRKFIPYKQSEYVLKKYISFFWHSSTGKNVMGRMQT